MPHIELSYTEMDAILTGAVPELVLARLQDARKEPTAREREIVRLAHANPYVFEGSVEIDNLNEGLPLISEGEGNGAFVMGWIWADFNNTDLDKEPIETEEAIL